MRRDDICIYVSPANRARFEAIIADRPHMVMSYSKNQKVAKDFLRWVHTPASYEKWFISQKPKLEGQSASCLRARAGRLSLRFPSLRLPFAVRDPAHQRIFIDSVDSSQVRRSSG